MKSIADGRIKQRGSGLQSVARTFSKLNVVILTVTAKSQDTNISDPLP